MTLRNYLLLGFAALALCACAPKTYTYTQTSRLSNVSTDSIRPDPSMQAMVLPYKQQLDSLMNEVIGFAPKELPRDMDMYESHLGNFCTDLMQQHSTKLLGKPVDMGMITIGGLRVPIPEGNIVLGTIFELMPFENEIVVLTIKGKDLMPAFERILVKKNISISNTKVVFKKGRLMSIEIGGQPFDPEKEYTVAVSDYLAQGGDYMDFLQKATKTEMTHKKVRDYIIDYIRELTAQGKQATATVGERVLID